jgi:hypothetical protein
MTAWGGGVSLDKWAEWQEMGNALALYQSLNNSGVWKPAQNRKT